MFIRIHVGGVTGYVVTPSRLFCYDKRLSDQRLVEML